MHFEILVEGQAELTALSILMSQIVGIYSEPHTWSIHKHRGIGKLPEKPYEKPNKNDQTLLHNLPSKLRAYGLENRDDVVVIILVDLDDRPDCREFKNKLVSLLEHCKMRPNTLFRIAIEELEAWYFGDHEAISQAYPKMKQSTYEKYIQDSQCGTWEKLAEVIFPGGMKELVKHGKRSKKILEQKRIWAKNICPYIDVETNKSPSFKKFRDGIRKYL